MTKKKRPKFRDQNTESTEYLSLKPHRATLVLVLGILSIVSFFLCFCGGVVLGPIAWAMGNRDLKEMADGQMDRAGEGTTDTGRICGRAGFFLNLLVCCLLVCLGAIQIVGQNANSAFQPSRLPPTSEPPSPEFKPLPGKEYVTNSIGMKLVKVPAGKFTMGSPATDQGGEDGERPQHEVEITQPFYMGVYEVTREEYQTVRDEGTGLGLQSRGAGVLSRFPAEYVSWEDAREFCRKLSAIAEEKQAGWEYRLPTEAEWEYACRAGTTTVFHYGNSLASTQANFDGDHPYGGANKGPNLQVATIVGSYKPNTFGLYDMHGNVYEWCADWYDEIYYKTSPKQDPENSDLASYKVMRGGSWSSIGNHCRSAFRHRRMPDSQADDNGFRVVAVQSER